MFAGFESLSVERGKVEKCGPALNVSFCGCLVAM